MVDELDEFQLPRWPAAERNKEPLLRALLPRLPFDAARGDEETLFLEIAAATGQHMQHFFAELATYFEGIAGRFRYQATDYDAEHLATLQSRVQHLDSEYLCEPLRLDASEAVWPVRKADVIYNANMIHIAPFAVAEGLFAGVGRILTKEGIFFLYGPFGFAGEMHASNREFDANLKGRNPAWGVRNLDDLTPLAARAGLELVEQVAMPANNHLLVWRRIGG